MTKIKHLGLIFVLLFAITVQSNSADITVFFYNPDAAPPDPSIMIKKAGDYFAKANPSIKIQPVIDPAVFVKLIDEEKKAQIIITPPAVLKTLKSKYKELLSPVNDANAQTYKRIVVVKEGAVKSLDELKGKTIGSTSLGAESMDFLNEFVFSAGSYDVKNSKIVFVKKDLDALLAAKFGQLQAAVIAERNLATIGKSQPQAVKDTKVLLTSKDIPEAPLCVIDGTAADVEGAVKKAFADMGGSPEGQEFLKLLGYSKWVEK